MSVLDGPLRGRGIGSVLQAQRDYAAVRGERVKFGLMVPEAFVRGIRDLGYRSNADAMAELIDNALQAYAERIDVVFGYAGGGSTKKPVQMAVIDNGHGMEAAMIRMAIMWGGTHRENDRSGLGRYGYGLPCAAVSLGRRFTVLSKVEGSSLYSVTLDLDDLMSGQYNDGAGDIIVPEPSPATLPAFVEDHMALAYPDGWHSGTIILLDKLDRLEWLTTSRLADNFIRQFGTTYHKLRGQAAIYVDRDFVEPIDPLFLTPGFRFFDLDDDRAHLLDPVRVEVRDPESGGFLGAMTLRYAWLPPSFGSIDKARDAVGINANPRFQVLKDYHGIIFSRNGRLIDVQTRTPWTTFINNDRYIKVEVEFSAGLDELFGVTTSKQQVTVSTFIWDLLRAAGLPKAIEQLRIKVKEAKVARRVEALVPKPGERLASERVMSSATFGAESAGAARQLGLALRLSPYSLLFEHAPDKPFFRIDRQEGGRALLINTAHRFYDDIYDGPASTPEMRTALELMLFCFGDAVLDASDEKKTIYAQHVAGWSRRLELALAMLAEHLARGEEEDVGAMLYDPTLD